MIITVIAYRENCVDTCRGCVMGREDSDLQMLVSDNPEEVVEFVVDLKVGQAEELGSYDFSYFVNGYTVESDAYVQTAWVKEPDWDAIEQYEKVVDDIRVQALKLTEQRLAKRREEKVALERQKAEDAERLRKAYDIAQLKKLREAYPEV